MQTIAASLLRPQRPVYTTLELGPRYFTLQGSVYLRTDFQIQNARKLRLKCSLFQAPSGSEKCVVYCHGNCGNRLDSLEVLDLILPLKMSFCTFDFSGSGHSDGDQVSFGFYEKDDISAVIDHLHTARHIKEVILWGRSMGAVAALLAASERSDIRAVVADSPFTSMKALVVDIINSYVRVPEFVSSFLVSKLRSAVMERAGFDFVYLLYRSIDVMRAVEHYSGPIVFVHSLEDTLVSASHSRQLYTRSQATSTLLEISGSHNDMRPTGVLRQVVDSLESALSPCDENTTIAVTIPCKDFEVKENHRHFRERTQTHAGSYSEQAFRMALQELVNR